MSNDAADASPQPSQSARDQITGLVADAVIGIAQSGSTDQVRGYANAAMGKTKLAVGLAIASPELALVGIAQTALGEAQKFIGEAKLAAETAEIDGEGAAEQADTNSALPPDPLSVNSAAEGTT